MTSQHILFSEKKHLWRRKISACNKSFKTFHKKQLMHSDENLKYTAMPEENTPYANKCYSYTGILSQDYVP